MCRQIGSPSLLSAVSSRSKYTRSRGGLNGSTQHSGRTWTELKIKAKSLARFRSAGTLPWLGFDRV